MILKQTHVIRFNVNSNYTNSHANYKGHDLGKDSASMFIYNMIQLINIPHYLVY